MRILFNKKFLFHNKDSEYEGAYRLEGFSKKYMDEDFDGERYIGLIHPQEYIEKFRNACEHGYIMAEVPLTSESYEAAMSSVGLAVVASMQGDFAAIRPPGHHAGREKPSGFCFFNNVAIAAQNLVNNGKKVLIIDFDGHHGDGTQEIFYESPHVFYSSIHQAFTFPHTGSPNETGRGEGLGYTLNIPIMPGSTDKDFLNVIDHIIVQSQQFKPDVVAVSAGFDGYEKDRLLNLKFTPKGYYECGFKLRRAFKNIFAVLEGGYHNDIHKCICSFVDGINIGSRPIRNRFNHEMSIG